jgi:hypothetical protein
MKWLLAASMFVVATGCSPGVSDNEGNPGGGLVDGGPPGDGGAGLPDAASNTLGIDYLDPPNGPYAGGATVIVHGRQFAGGMSVSVGGRAVDPTDIKVLDSHRVQIVTPPGDPGMVDVIATVNSISVTRANGYTYEAIYADPSKGAIAGGTYVRIRGRGTAFTDGDVAMIGGMLLVNQEIVNGTEIAGYTPGGIPGDADVVVISGGQTYTAKNGFTYEDTADAVFGGTSGGPINGAINVVIVDTYSGDGVPNAIVTVGDPATATLKGTTDAFGQVTLSTPGLHGPVTIVAGAKGWEQGAFVQFDAQNVTMFLTKMPDPNAPPPTGPFPPGRANAHVEGDIVFGGLTGIGTTTSWPLVPEPRTPSEGKRTYVFATAVDIFSGNPDPGDGGTVDYVDGQSSWGYSIPVRPSAFALVAVAGLYDPTINPDATPPGQFTPFAMGVKRNMLAGPGESLTNVPIVIDIPLDTSIYVQLGGTPALLPVPTTGAIVGPTEYHVNALVDLGGEGVVLLPGGHTVFSDKPSTILDGMAPLANEISDASYAFVVGTYTQGQSYPVSTRITRGTRDLSQPVVIDTFLPIPRLTDTMDMGGMLPDRHIRIGQETGPTGRPTIIEHRIFDANGIATWRIFGRGDQLDIPLYDLTTVGLPPVSDTMLGLYTYEIYIPGGTFDEWNYGQLNANLWGAYSENIWGVGFPDH